MFLRGRRDLTQARRCLPSIINLQSLRAYRQQKESRRQQPMLDIFIGIGVAVNMSAADL